jgi:isoleucyl-tRNA synthetase
MSKSRGNVVDPWAVLSEFGADIVRLYLVSSSHVWLQKRFNPKEIGSTTGKFTDTLRNTYEFFARYAGEWKPGQGDGSGEASDQWIRGRLNATVAAVHASLDGYDVTTGNKELIRFLVDDVSNWYVRINRKRFWAVDSSADPAALGTLHAVRVTVARLLAPTAPFMSDWMHRQLTGASVHLASFPRPAATAEDPALHGAMDAVRRLTSMIRSVREDIRLNVRQPLARVRVAVPAQVRGPLFTQLLAILRVEVNVKAVEVVEADTDLVRLKPKANFRALGKRYGKETPQAAAAAGSLSQEQLRQLEAGAEVTQEVEGAIWTYQPDDVSVEREVVTSWPTESDGPYVVALDPERSDALMAEGFAREVVSQVQRARKDAGYEFTTRIRLAIDGANGEVTSLQPHTAFIKEETLARELLLGSRLPVADLEQEIDIDGHKVTIGVKQYDS